RADVVEQKVEILEGPERCEIEEHGGVEKTRAAGPPVRLAQYPGGRDLRQRNHEKTHVPPRVEHQRGDDQDVLPKLQRARREIVKGCNEGQEDEHIALRLKQHAARPSARPGLLLLWGKFRCRSMSARRHRALARSRFHQGFRTRNVTASMRLPSRSRMKAA